MDVTRRSFFGAAAGAGLLAQPSVVAQQRPPADRFDPWVEVVADNLRFNVAQVRRLSGDRPIVAVVKNNAYGLGMVGTAQLLEPLEAIAGFAVVKTDAALALRAAGITKPVLHMGINTLDEAHELVARNVELSLYTDDAAERVRALARKAGQRVRAHVYLDTGLGRLGMPYHRAVPWLRQLVSRDDLEIAGAFMCFSEDLEFDKEQLARFQAVVRDAGAPLGKLHAASSTAVYHQPEARLDAVRPGIALYGGYPHTADEERAKAELRSAVRLRCRVIRVAQLRAGDTAGYGRKFAPESPTWVATIPVGHVDGVPRVAVEGARVLIGGATYPVVGTVSASHSIVALGEERTVAVGDVATVIGPDHGDVDPNTIAARTGASVYDVFMHLNPSLPRFVV